MFLIVPHSAEVRYGRVPWVTLTIALLCVVISYLQENRREAIANVIEPYCDSIHEMPLEDRNDFFRSRRHECEDHLTYLHTLPDRSRYEELQQLWWDSLPEAEEQPDRSNGGNVISQNDLTAMTQYAYQHYENISDELPPSLDRKLVYDPTSPNLLRAIIASLSHSDWWHLIGNLIFFFAFAPVVEYIIATALRFTLSLVGIAFSVGLVDSLAILFGSPGNITLGLSGVVMGVIGMSAYLMPDVRIRTFVWIMHFARNIPVPAWILAVGYIGLDIYDLSTSDWMSGVNFLAHVAGGISGYLIARYFFKQRREETAEEVADEVAYMTARRNDQLGVMSSYRSSSNHFGNLIREDSAKREYERYIDDIHRAVTTGQDSRAIIMLLDRYEDYRESIEIFEDIYREMLKWPHTRAILCLSRLLVSEYLKQKKYARAADVAKAAYAITPDFIFACNEDRDLLRSMSNKYQLDMREE